MGALAGGVPADEQRWEEYRFNAPPQEAGYYKP